MLLADDGKVALNAPISRYLPDTAKTVASLARFISGTMIELET